MPINLEQQADLLFANIKGWETSTLERIGKRIKKIGKMSIADVQALNNIADVKGDMEAIKKELSKVTGMNVRQIEQIYADVLEEQHLANKPLYDYRNKVFVPFAENTELQAIAKAYAKSTAKTMVNLSKTKMLNVRNERGQFVKLQKGYCDILDKATMQVASGATDFHTAMREAISQMGSGGLRVDYGSGVTRRLDTVVRQNLLWGAKQVSIAYNEMIGEELGCDGIEIDYHSNPRPSHAFMQGKQYVLGKARKCNGIYFESADEALERLEDYNCYHYKTPIICGISEPRYSEKELAELKAHDERTFNIDGHEMTGYQASQAMRRLETAVREQKGIKAMAQASGDPLAVRECNERIKRYQDKYAEISDITGIAQDKKRMTLTKSADSGKIKEKSQNKILPQKETTANKTVAIGKNSDLSSNNITANNQSLRGNTAKSLDNTSQAFMNMNTSFTQDKLKMMNRKQLETVSTNVFIQKNMADGLSFTEAKKRATALMDGNTDAQLRQYIKQYGRNSSKQIKPDNVVVGHFGTPKKAKPNTVIDHKTSEKQVDIRSFYGSDGYKKKDIHTTDHGNPKQHPFGNHGEHAEDYEWDNDGRLKNKTRRELTEIEREENSDIL